MQVDELILAAQRAQVADIYLLPTTTGYHLKYHRDGQLEAVAQLAIGEGERLIGILKYQADMNVVEKRRPQVGRFEQNELTIRVSTVGDYLNRETAVLRLLYDDADMPKAWLDAQQFAQLQLDLPAAGLVVLAGPTGSGKTSTIYDLLRNLSSDKLVLTIEDPVEVRQADLVQLQVNDLAQMDYQALIKVALRHHPEVLFVGEIRDARTAQAALQAALSGHLVLTTVHALSAPDIVLRLQQLGLPTNQLQTALSGVVYQRLVPLLAGGQAAVLDARFGMDLEAIWQNRAPKFSQKWQEVLANASQQKQISAQMAAYYQNGHAQINAHATN